MAKAKDTLFQNSDIPHGKNFIELIVEPSFNNHFKILIKWKKGENRVTWTKTTWEKLLDAHKFNNNLETEHDISPTFSYQNGIIEEKYIEQVISSLKSLSIRPNLEPFDLIVLDGTYTTLKIGGNKNYMAYSWHLLPNDWEELEVIIDKIVKLEKFVVKF
jgi:hypothetical protein